MRSSIDLQRSLGLAAKIQGWQGNTFAFWEYSHSVYIGFESRDFEASHFNVHLGRNRKLLDKMSPVLMSEYQWHSAKLKANLGKF